MKDFVSEDKTFQITFPGIPKITKQEMENAAVTSHRIYRQGSNSIVNVYDYGFEIEGQKDKILETVKNNLLKKPKSTIESEKDIEIGGLTGKELQVLQDYQFQIIRILITGKRIYELKNDVTNWHILSKFNNDKVEEFKVETRRFFDSFKIIQSSEVVLQTPNDFAGTSTATNYTNTFFGFTFDFPKDWTRRTSIDTPKNNPGAVEKVFSPEAINNKVFQESLKRSVSLFYISQKNEGKDRTSLNVGIVKQPSPQTTSEEVIATTKQLVTIDSNKKVVGEMENIIFNGTRFSTITFQIEMNGLPIYTRLYTTIRKGYAVSFTMGYLNDDGLKTLEKIVKTIKFDTK
ncbi:MAG TPA: hypothetical protein VGD05_04950 [Pyrinomonadaceae bacterium]